MATPSGSSIAPSAGPNSGGKGKQFPAGMTVYSAKTPSTGGVPQKRTLGHRLGCPRRQSPHSPQQSAGPTAVGEKYGKGKALLAVAFFRSRRYDTEGDLREAERHFRQAAALFERLGIPFYVREVDREWKKLREKQGSFDLLSP